VIAPEISLEGIGFSRIAGVDEAGRGACAGPLIIAAVILPRSDSGVDLSACVDSKSISEAERERRFERVKEVALAYSIIEVPASEIDEVGLHISNLAGMRRAISALAPAADYALTDGYAIDGLTVPNLAVWKGDSVSRTIGAASILAKVTRDRIMRELAVEYPEYGLEIHKGYVTAAHKSALLAHGPSKIHRFSFANIAALA
jgi:ribonuclease HII